MMAISDSALHNMALPSAHHKEEEESSGEGHIYIRAETNDGLTQWYVIEKLADTGRQKSFDELEFLGPVLFDDGIDMEYKEGSACVALGSVIYVIGGFQSKLRWRECLDWSVESRQDMPSITTNEVYYIDTLRPETGWTRAPPMLIKRSHSHAFALDGKIYVMGGFVPETGSLPPPYYAEVFDPSEKESGWQPAFSDIPEPLAHGITFVHQLRNRQLLVYGVAKELGFRYSYDFDHKEDFDDKESGFLYSYDFDDKRWNLCYKGDFDPRCCYCKTETATLFDDIMYCYNTVCPSNHLYTAPGTIMGFDAKNPTISPKIVRGLEEERDFLPKPDYYRHFPRGNLLRLGGAKLCLVLKEDNSQGFILTFLKFTVSKEHNSSGEVVDLVATDLSKSTFCLQATSIYNYFAMPAYRGSERKEDICCNTSAPRTASLATINDRNEECSGNATAKMKRKKEKKA